uniref:Uncharacterized protein n=1 Tax=Rhipicephalus microplus TaxID=6941 RepID=A0A6G5AH82_RHIMP
MKVSAISGIVRSINKVLELFHTFGRITGVFFTMFCVVVAFHVSIAFHVIYFCNGLWPIRFLDCRKDSYLVTVHVRTTFGLKLCCTNLSLLLVLKWAAKELKTC